MILICAEVEVTEAMFRGREGVKYELSGGGRTSLPILAARDSIQFQFKTTKSTGLLYYNGN